MSMSFFSHSEESTCFLNMYIMDEKIDDNCILTGAVEAWTPVPQEYKSDALLKNIRTPNFFSEIWYFWPYEGRSTSFFNRIMRK